jgi:teichuronic acid biosynthesis glycosyltransferase TuaC
MYPTSTDPTLGTFVEQQVKGFEQIGMKVDIVLLNRAENGMRVYLGTRQLVKAAVRDFDPDIVHVMYGGVMADMVTAAVDDRPTVISFCGDDLLGELLSGSIRKFVSKWGIVCSYRAARRAHGIVVKSKNLQDALPADVATSKVRIIPNGIDLERFKPLDRTDCRDRLSWPDDRLNVLVPTSHGDPRKRPELACAAVTAAERLGLKVEIHHLKNIPHDQVPVWLNASDVVLLTSLHEGSPNVIKEALACDVPIVSVEVGDVRERIQEVDGCYIADSDPNDLASKLKLVHDGSGRVNGRRAVLNLSLHEVALRIKDFYDEILSASSARQAV